jgi:hypothetical protein
MKDHFYFIILILLLAVSCNVDKNKKVDSQGTKFGMTSSSLLFFKNVRQYYYEKQDNEAAKLWVHRFAKRQKEAEYPLINLAIVINWRFEQAYLLLEPVGFLDGQEQILVKWNNEKSGESGIYTFEYGNKETHLTFATDIYNGILDEVTFSVINGEEELPFLKESLEREAFRITTFDYLKLISKL